MKTSTSSASTRRLRAALLGALATGTLPVLAQEAPLVPANNGLEEIPDEELGQMRGRYTVGDNRVLWFGVSMITTWQTQAGQTVRGNLDVAIDLRGQRPTVTFTPNVNISEGASDAQTHIASGGSIDSAGLANVSGMVQSVQVAGDGNRAGNSTRLVVRSGDVPVSRQTYAAGASRAGLVVPCRGRRDDRRRVARMVAESAQLAQQDLVGRAGVLRVQLEHRALEILHGVKLAVERAALGELVADGVDGLPTLVLALQVELERAGVQSALSG